MRTNPQIQSKWKNYASIGLLILLSYLLLQEIVLIILVGLFDGYKSLKIREYGLNTVGFELSTVSAVIAGITYGSLTGALIGLTVCLIAHLVSGSIGIYLLWKLPGAALAGIISALSGDIVFLSLILPIGLRLFYLALTLRYFPSMMATSSLYEITCGIASYLMIGNIAPHAIKFLSQF